MYAPTFQRMHQLAEGREAELTKKAKAREGVQDAFERLHGSLPSLHAKVNQLIPGLMGPDVLDPEGLKTICTDLEDLARRLAKNALTLRERIEAHAAVKEGPTR